MKKKWEKSPQNLIDIFYAAMQEFPEAELRKMFGYPCAFVKGNMWVGLHEHNFIVRLSSDLRERALEEKKGAVFAPMNRVMKEYLALSPEIIYNKRLLHEILASSFHYTHSLPPKTGS